MNQIERLEGDLARRFPGIAMSLDSPADERGSWFLDIRRDAARPVVVEWRPDRGFGLSSPGGEDYGSGPDEVYSNAKAVYERITSLILSGGSTQPPQAVRLAELRQLRGLTQEDLAARVGMGQANVSRIESREDVMVSTLYKVVSAMGASLSIRARFPDGTERELKFNQN